MTHSRIRLRLGTRSSALARWQADWVAERLRELGPEIELVPIMTQGDVRTGSLSTFGGVGVFTKELQRALLDETIDIAVHSLKDLPTEQPEELVLAAVPPRAPVHDALISNNYCRLSELPAGARVGTGSVRRRAQLLGARPDLRIGDIRGNVDTRLRRLDEGRWEAIVLAEAGLHRLGLKQRIAERLEPPLMLPAVGQGALAIETRAADSLTRYWVAHLDDVATHAAVVAERGVLRRLRAGCLAPVAAWCRFMDGRLWLDAAVFSDDGSARIAVSVDGSVDDAEIIGEAAARRLIEQGAEKWLRSARTSE